MCFECFARTANNRVEHAHGVRSTRNGEAPLLAAHSRRWAAQMSRTLIFVILLIGVTPLTSHSQSSSARMLTPDDSIVVSRDSIESKDAYDVIWSNVDFLNALFAAYIGEAEVSRDALMSYYVDYYLAQVNNGGFSQFVYNSRWDPEVVGRVRKGLGAMNAKRNLALFEEGAALVSSLGEAKLKTFLASEYFGDNRLRDQLAAIDDRFFDLQKDEDLIRLNSAWLKRHPKLVVVSKSELTKEVAKRAAAVPDRAVREKRALDAEPQFTKLIRLLCAKTGQTLERITAGDPTHKYQGKEVLAWHFITDKGHHYMVEADGKAMMFDGTSHAKLAEIDAQ
jgi:hypothetical protein